MSSYPDIVSEFLNARSLTRLAQMMKALRLRRGLTQAELAAKAQVSRQWLIALESKPPAGLEVGRLMRVLDALDASLYLRDDEVA
ncbi:MAG: helix-turn-helix transcriptional regulator [Propioniciclava sp.]|uniref:helix-turn-helix transcriptional regulator n=1 Tax=Propioniciclava sp. TaxID=2038686 RepID=UPI0039E36E7C